MISAYCVSMTRKYRLRVCCIFGVCFWGIDTGVGGTGGGLWGTYSSIRDKAFDTSLVTWYDISCCIVEVSTSNRCGVSWRSYAVLDTGEA